MAVALALGIAAAAWWQAVAGGPLVWAASLAAVGSAALGILAVLPRADDGRWACVAGTALLAGFGIACARLAPALPHGGHEGLACLEGRVASAPRESAVGADALAGFAPSRASAMFELDVEAFVYGGVRTPVQGSVLVRVTDLGELPPRGTRIRATGWFRPPGTALNPGARAPPGDGTLAIPRRTLIEPLGAPTPTLAQRLRRAANTALDASMPAWSGHSVRALVKAMTTGVRDPALTIPAAEFRAAGMSHVLAISGFNVAVLVGAAATAAALLGAGVVGRSIVALAVSGLFLLVTEPEVSVLRAGLGAGLAAAAGLRGGRARGLGTLGAVAAATLVADPAALFTAGFQLSYGVVAALLTLAHPAARRWQARVERVNPGAPWTRWHETTATVARWFAAACVSSAVAFTASTPIALWHGGFASAYAAPVSVITMPAAALVTIGGVMAAAAGAFAPALGALPAGVACVAAGLLAWVARSTAEWPGAIWWIGRPALWWVVLALASVCVLWAAPWRVLRAGAAVSLAGLALAAWCGAAQPHAVRVPPGTLRLDALNTGGGACALVRSSEHAVLIDAGSAGDDSAGSRRIVPALAALGVRHLDAVVVTRDRLASFSGVPEVVRALAVRRVVVPADTLDPQARVSRAFRALVHVLHAEGVVVEAADAPGAYTANVHVAHGAGPPPEGVIAAGDLRIALATMRVRLAAWPEDGRVIVPRPIGDATPARRVELRTNGDARAWIWSGSAWHGAEKERALQPDEVSDR